MDHWQWWRIRRSQVPAEIARAWELGFHGKFTFGDDVIYLKSDAGTLTIFIYD